jgi:hypothetical protein
MVALQAAAFHSRIIEMGAGYWEPPKAIPGIWVLSRRGVEGKRL